MGPATESTRFCFAFAGDVVPSALQTTLGRLVEGIRFQGRAFRWYGKSVTPHHHRVEWFDLDVAHDTYHDAAAAHVPKRQRKADPAPSLWTPIGRKRTPEGTRQVHSFATGNIYASLRDRVQLDFPLRQTTGINSTVRTLGLRVTIRPSTTTSPTPDPGAELHQICIKPTDGKSHRVSRSLDQLLNEFSQLDETAAELDTRLKTAVNNAAGATSG